MPLTQEQLLERLPSERRERIKTRAAKLHREVEGLQARPKGKG